MFRNALLSVAPIISSPTASCFLVYLLLFANLCLDLSLQPWRSRWVTSRQACEVRSYLKLHSGSHTKQTPSFGDIFHHIPSSTQATYMDVLTNASFLLILFQGAFYVENVHDTAGMVTCGLANGRQRDSVQVRWSCAASSSLSPYCACALYPMSWPKGGAGRASTSLTRLAALSFRKRFHYFVTHHKEVAGSLARLQLDVLQM